jgi:MscS family membrane protein
MRTVSTGIHDLLLQHRSAEPESVRVRFFRLGPSSLDIEVVAYFFAADWVAFTAIQQDLLLRVMEIVEAAGTQIAFPTQTVQFVDDRASSEAWTPLRPERGTPREPSPAGAEAKAYANGKVVST